MLVIDPDECIDCTLCVAECPVEAILRRTTCRQTRRNSLPSMPNWPRPGSRSWRGRMPADADEWAKVKEKAHLLEKVVGPR